MTGRLRLGKMSMGMRNTARTLPRTTAATSTMTVRGRLKAKTIGFIGMVHARPGRLALPKNLPLSPTTRKGDAHPGDRDIGIRRGPTGRGIEGNGGGQNVPE